MLFPDLTNCIAWLILIRHCSGRLQSADQLSYVIYVFLNGYNSDIHILYLLQNSRTDEFL